MLGTLEADRSLLADLNALEILGLDPVQERLDSIKYPILTLSNEITTEIFIHFLPIYPLCPPLVGNLSPTTLAHVCREWREIALATPMLWRAFGFSSHSDSSRQYNIRDIWLSRSGCYPFSISVNDQAAAGSNFLGALVPHKARWESLQIFSRQSDLHDIQGALPLLRHLDLDIARAIEWTVHDAPLLRTVVLTGFCTSQVTLPWMQLTALTLCDPTPSSCAAILRQTSNLVHCELWIKSSYIWPNNTLPYLESLILKDWGLQAGA